MRKYWAEWLLLGILALGLVNLSLILLRGHFVQETDDKVGLFQRSSFSSPFPKAKAYFSASLQGPQRGPPGYQAAVIPDGVTGATPRTIALQIETIIQRLRPAVVGIRGGGGGAAPLWTQGWGAQHPSQSFGYRSGPQGGPAYQPAPANWELGSGVVVHPQGYIVTNYHVVILGPDIRVAVFSAAGSRDYPGRIIFAHPDKDLALLKIEPVAPLVSMPIGDSDLARTGDQVIGIGNPFGLSQTVTKGIISAKRRNLIIGTQNMHNLIQTDVPINPGNSGGALCNLRGQLIGINVAIYSPRESVYSGVSLAIPVNEVKDLYGGYMDFTQQPPYAGLRGTLARQDAGPQQPVNLRWPSASPPGGVGQIAANIVLKPDALVANPPRIPVAQKIMPSPGEGIEELAWLGIDMTPELEGVGIDEIEGISPMEAGLQAGDILKAINGIPTPDLYAVKDAIKAVPLRTGQAVVLDVYRPRDNRSLYISFRLKKWDIRGR